MIPLKDFKAYLINQPDATVEGIYGKSIELLGKNSAVVAEDFLAWECRGVFTKLKCRNW